MSRPGKLDPRYLGSLASGLLLWVAFPPLDQGLLAWVALVPLFWVLRDASPRAAFRLGYATGLLWFALTLSWISLFGVVTWALLALILALYIGGFAALFRLLAQRYWGLDLLLLPLTWTAVEVVRSTGPLGFPWALLGVSQVQSLPVLQVGALGGVHLISLLIAAGNAWLVELSAWARAPAARSTGVIGMALIPLLLIVALTFGVRRQQMPLRDSLVVAVLQPNISPARKGEAETYQEQMNVLRRLTGEARAQGADLIVFPETAVPVNLFGPGAALREVASWAPERVVVASSFEIEADGVRNTAVPLEQGEARGVYAKRRLVPFGEAGVTPGRRGDPIPTRLGPLGIAICYESAFAEISRAAAQSGARLLLVLTNDGWFGTTGGPAQHAAYAPLRAVETGRPVLRAANTGISMIVDPLGRVRGSLPLNVRSILMGEVPADLTTPYLGGGWLIGPAVVAAVVGLALPAAVAAVRSWRQDPAFARVLGTAVVPGLAVLADPLARRVAPGVAPWLIPSAILVAAWVTGGGARGLAFNPRRAVVSLLLGLAVVIGLGVAMVSAYSRYGFFPQFGPPDGGWMRGGVVLLLSALAWEGWLRGAVFSAAEAWRGPRVALLLSALLPLAARPVGPPEVLIWSVFVGAIFGVIRWRTGDALGLVIPRAAGLILLGVFTVLS